MDPRFTEALQAVRALEEGGYESRLAGGCVRDRVLGLTPKDYDIATTAEPTVVQRLFSQRGQKIIPTGLDHGTVTLVGQSGQYEITTLRRDVCTDGRRAVVAFSKSFAEDAERRDFTVNAMYEDAHGQIHDYFRGLDHLKEKRLVFVGDASLRIREDYLRILRLFRFWARLGFQPDQDALAIIPSLAGGAGGLQMISQERITGELLQILATSDPHAALEAMSQLGVWALILPEAPLSPPSLKVIAAIRGESAGTDEKAIVRLAVIFAVAAVPDYAAVGRRLRLSTADVHKLRCFAASLERLQSGAFTSDVAACMDFVDFVDESAGVGSFQRIFCEALRAFLEFGSRRTDSFPEKEYRDFLGDLQQIVAVEAAKGSLRRQPMPLNGKYIIRELQLSPGPQMKLLLSELKARFRRGEWSSPAEGLKVAAKILAKK